MRAALVIAALSAAAGFGLAWNLQAHQITKLELNHANERMAYQRQAHQVKERQTDAVIAAQNAGAVRAVALKRDAAAAHVAADGLRDDLDTTMRAAATSIDACNRHAATVSQLLVKAVGVGRELAQACDGHASDVRTLMEAWPK